MNPNLLWWLPFLPFLGFLLNFFTAIPACLVAWLWSTLLAPGAPESISTTAGDWIRVSGFHVPFSFTVDHLTLIMLAIITGLGFIIHL